MQKGLKIAGIVAGLFILLFGAFFVLAKIFITPERIRNTVLPLAKEALRREVKIGNIEISFFSGVVIDNLTIEEPGGGEPFIKADKVLLRYLLAPLLAKKVVIDEVRLDTPRVRIVRRADGTFNFSDLSATPAVAATKTAPPAEEKEAVNLLVSKVSLTKGALTFLDSALTKKEPVTTTLEELTVKAENISPEKPFPLNLSARVNGTLVEIRGEIDHQAKAAKMTVKTKDFDVVRFASYFKAALPGKLTSAKAAADILVTAAANNVAAKGTLAVSELDLVLDAMPDMPLAKTTITLSLDGRANLAQDTLDLGSVSLTISGLPPVQATGKVTRLKAGPELALALTIPEFDLAQAIAALPEKTRDQAKPFTPKGRLSANLHLNGPLQEPLKMLRGGQLDLKGVEVTAGAIRPSLNGGITIKGSALSSKALTIKAGEDTVTLDLSSPNLAAKPAQITTSLKAARFNIDPLLPPAAGKDTPPQTEKKDAVAGAAGDEPGPLDLPVNIDGRVEIGQALYKGLTIDNLAIHFRLVNNVFTLDKMTGRTADGTFDTKAKIDLGHKGFTYSGDAVIKQMQSEQFVNAMAPKMKDSLFGTMNFAMTANGAGTTQEKLEKNLAGKGDFQVTDGKLTGGGFMKSLGDFLGLEQLRILRFSKLDGKFTIADGKINLVSDVQGSDVHMSPNGDIGLDNTVDLALDIRLAPPLAAKLGTQVGQFLNDDKGWAQLPLKATGTLSSPHLTVDTAMVTEKLKEKAGAVLQQKLQKGFLDKVLPGAQESPAPQQPTGQPETPPPTNPTKDVQDAIKGLFGR